MQPRPSKLITRTAMACTAVAVFVASAPAQELTVRTIHETVFAKPAEVSFAHIKAAMESGTIYTEQIRRLRSGTTVTAAGAKVPTYTGTYERMVYRSADANTAELFRLELAGIEGRKLTTTELAAEQASFLATAGFKFRYHGFRVGDAADAAAAYTLYHLVTTTRKTTQGTRNVYRFAVVPQKWDRNAWLLELDTRTGYPLYAGEFSFANSTFTLESELIVTNYQTGVRVPSASHASWWRPVKGVEALSTPLAAAKKALADSTSYPLPVAADLPSGYKLLRNEVLTDPYTGEKRALFTFGDGLSHVFVQQRNVTAVSRGDNDQIFVLDEGGLTQCQFQHAGIEFHIAGRSNGSAMRQASSQLFARAIATMK
jgi:hypothetical protein